MQEIYGGVINLKSNPDIVFIIGLKENKNALQEAKLFDIPVVAVCNSDCNPKWVDYILIGSDRNPDSISFFVNLMTETILKLQNKNGGENSLKQETKVE